MGYRHRRRTVQRTHKELLRYETSVTAWSTTNTTPQIAATDSFPDAVLPTAFNDDHPLAVDDNQEDVEPFVTNQNENEPSIIVDQNDHEPLVGLLDSRDKVLSLEHFSENNELELSKTDEAMLSVYHFASQRGVSIAFIEDLFMLLRRLDSSGGSIDLSTTKTKKTLLKRLKKYMETRKKTPLPTVVRVTSTASPVLRFSLLDQIKDLIDSQIFQNLDNLVINENSAQRFHMYNVPEGEEQLEIHSAKWYQDTYDKLVVDPNHDLLFPLIFYIDKTGTDVMQRFPLEPLMFTTSLLKRGIRENTNAWRHLGFIPPCDRLDATAEYAMQSFHECLSELLSELKELQLNPPTVSFTLDGKTETRKLLLPVAFVMGDQLSQDKHCGRKAINNGSAGKAHRKCWCSSMSASDGGFKCYEVDKIEIEKLISICKEVSELGKILPPATSNARLHQSSMQFVRRRSRLARCILGRLYSMYPITNAWSDICFGANRQGIYSATLDDPMHYLESGSMLYVAEVAFLSLTNNERKEVENNIRSYFSTIRSTVREDFPRAKLSSGFSRTTLLTASEKVGLLHQLFVTLGTPKTEHIFTKAIARLQERYETMPTSTSVQSKRGDNFFFLIRRRKKT
jgi:hypothetical protein